MNILFPNILLIKLLILSHHYFNLWLSIPLDFHFIIHNHIIIRAATWTNIQTIFTSLSRIMMEHSLKVNSLSYSNKQPSILNPDTKKRSSVLIILYLLDIQKNWMNWEDSSRKYSINNQIWSFKSMRWRRKRRLW